MWKACLAALLCFALWPIPGAAQNEAWKSHMDAAVAAHRLGNAARAEDQLQAALRLAETFGPADPRLAETLKGLALVYFEQQAFEKAVPLLERAIDIDERNLGAEHRKLGQSLNALAIINTRLGAYERAEPLYRRALAIFRKALGPDHVHVAQVLESLAGLFLAQARYDEAETHYRLSLAAFERGLGPKHPDVARLLESYAGVLRLQGRIAQAEDLEARARAIRDGPGDKKSVD
jgi:tetratricopeptide (TPR) repeat protein